MGCSEKSACRESRRVLALRVGVLREAKIDDFHRDLASLFAHEHHVRRLDVAVHQTLFLRCSQGAGDLRSNFQRHQSWNRTLSLDKGLDGLPIDELHCVEIIIRLAPEVENGRHIRMPESRRRSRLAQKPLPGRLAVEIGRFDDLERDMTAQVCIKGLVGDSHSAVAQLVGRAVFLSQDLEMLEPKSLRHVRASSKATGWKMTTLPQIRRRSRRLIRFTRGLGLRL